MQPLLTPETLASTFGLSVSASREVMKAKDFKSIKIGTRYYVSVENAMEYFSEKRTVVRSDSQPERKR